MKDLKDLDQVLLGRVRAVVGSDSCYVIGDCLFLYGYNNDATCSDMLRMYLGGCLDAESYSALEQSAIAAARALGWCK